MRIREIEAPTVGSLRDVFNHLADDVPVYLADGQLIAGDQIAVSGIGAPPAPEADDAGEADAPASDDAAPKKRGRK